MPNAVSGFTAAEIVSYIQNFTGNTSADFGTFLEQTIPLAEFRYCKAHDWRFLYKVNLPLSVASGTDEYTLNSSSIGYYMQADDVKNIYNATEGIYLKKTSLETIRRADPDSDDGSTSEFIAAWAPIGDNKIILYPKVFADTDLRIDGKILPTALFTTSNYPTIPIHYQDSFIAYVLFLALDRENDDRAGAKRQEAMELITRDIQADLAGQGSAADEPRIKSAMEALFDGAANNNESLYLRSLFNS